MFLNWVKMPSTSELPPETPEKPVPTNPAPVEKPIEEQAVRAQPELPVKKALITGITGQVGHVSLR